MEIDGRGGFHYPRQITIGGWNGYGWKSVNGDWDWDDFYYKVYMDGDDGSFFTQKVYNNNDINEYVKLRPPQEFWETYLNEEDEDEWLKKQQTIKDFFSTEREDFIIYQKKEYDDWSWKQAMNNHRKFIARLNRDKYNELKNKLNKTIRIARKNKDWSKFIKVWDKYDWRDDSWEETISHRKQTFLFGKRFGRFIWVKTTLHRCCDDECGYMPTHRKDYEEWKIYKIYEQVIKFKPNRKCLIDKTDKDFILPKKIEEYIVPIRDINTHHKSTHFIDNKKLTDDIYNMWGCLDKHK